ncbi:helix-turn-helix domain-containing protein [uncultured Ruminococcus sp.]|uniref:helix-turn-helix domain-containing protein n=1 Tax=uncultured Ruminococcus sp. TaxID=165186 RepID=UPI0025F7EF8E|nr:helix-turn-helix transcriptional regulator [uncultured Ruminococcus sp.]
MSIVNKKTKERNFIIMTYYRRLRDLREDNDLTQEALVKKLGMHKTTYTNYEQGKRDLPLQVAIKIAVFYNVSLDYLAGLTNEYRKLK